MGETADMGCYQRSQTGHRSDSGQSAVTARVQPHDSRKAAIKTTKRMEKQSNWGPVEKQVSKTEFKKKKKPTNKPKHLEINPCWPKQLGWRTSAACFYPANGGEPPPHEHQLLLVKTSRGWQLVITSLHSFCEGKKQSCWGRTVRNTGRAISNKEKQQGFLLVWGFFLSNNIICII